jgi:2-polyprenyl-6-methoxyphenol hydroxylase-like FAD-dependent oxidoreductase
VTLARADLSRLLFETVKGETEVLFSDENVALEERADHVQAQFRHAATRSFELVIGADGLHSNVRKLAFGPQQQFEKDLGYVVAAFETQGYRPRDEDVCVIYSEPDGRALRLARRPDAFPVRVHQ